MNRKLTSVTSVVFHTKGLTLLQGRTPALAPGVALASQSTGSWQLTSLSSSNRPLWMKHCTRVFILFWLFISTSCTLVKPNEIPKPNLPPIAMPTLKNTCGDNLNYMTAVNRMTTEQKKLELNWLDQELDQSESYCSILHLGMILSTPGSKFQKDKKAIKLFEKILTINDVSSSDEKFARLIVPHIKQRQGLRNKIGVMDKALKKYQTKNATLNKRITVLQAQINQLKKLETEIEKKEQSVITIPVPE